TTTVTYTFTDAAGNTSTCNFDVIIADNETPVVSTCPGDTEVNSDPGMCSAIINYVMPGFDDNCDGSDLPGTLTAGLSSGSAFPVGVTNVQYEYTDIAGKGPAVCSFTVTVNDNESSVITCPADVVQCADDAFGAVVTGIGLSSVSDNCTAPGNIAINYSVTGVTTATGSGDVSGEFFNVGVSAVEYTAVDESGNSIQCSFTVTINELPTTSEIAGNTSPVCYATGETYSVTGDAGSKYYWAIPASATLNTDTTGIGINSISVDFGSISGNITVTEVSDNGCAGPTRTLTVNLVGCELVADFETDLTEVCPGDTITFWSTSLGVTPSSTYTWDFGSGAQPATANDPGPVKVIYSTSGLKTVELSVTESVTDVVVKDDIINVNEVPDITLYVEDRCGDGEVIFEATTSIGNIVEFSLDGGNTVESTDNTAPFEYSTVINSGETEQVWGRALNSVTGCESAWDGPEEVAAYPIPQTSSISVVSIPNISSEEYLDIRCRGDVGIYRPEINNGTAYLWTVSALGIDSQQSNQIDITWDLPEGEYTIELQELSESGCLGTISESKIFVSDPQVSLGPDIEICEGETHLFSPDREFNSYRWHDGSTLNSYTGNSTETITLTALNEYSCEAYDEAELQVHENPTLELGNDTILCGENTYELYPGDYMNYEWSTGEISSSIIVYPGSGLIILTVTDYNNCKATDSIYIEECNPQEIFNNMTNTFTPNGDGVHDTWVINYLDAYPDAQVDVYDRNGKRVFHADGNYDNGWDGTFNGKELPMDTYYFVIDFKSDDLPVKKGTVTIVR
ncbi:MAG: HYR domain-containing protein, partial [Bacteroidales bacterium]|nr:HYR domain-containing protein [Bacteroidales bacterium]